MRPSGLPSSTALLALFLVISVATSACNASPESGALPQSEFESSQGLLATVTKVVDGDTIIVQVQDQTETVRLLGIDTPEKPGGPRPAECFGIDASKRAVELLPVSTPVLLTRDSETRDTYGRLLAFVHRANDGMFINLTMVEEGYATALFFAPNTALEPAFVDAANRARREWRGFWPACGAADVTVQVEAE